ncbi:MAG: IS110 family transposase [Candidatus Acidiferrales bacterium]
MSVYLGVDFHARTQTVCWCDTADGLIHQRTLDHERDDVRVFYSQFAVPAVVGLEATGYARWFHRLLESLGHRLLVGDAYVVRKCALRRQKNDRRDAELLLDLLLHGDFPAVHIPPIASQAVLRLLRYRQRLVEIQTKLRNGLQALALNHQLRLGPKLWSGLGQEKLLALELDPTDVLQRETSLDLLGQIRTRIRVLEKELTSRADQDARVRLLRTHPGVGLLTSLAVVHTLEPVTRFDRARRIAAYCGLDPRQSSSGDTVRMGHISKQGNRLLRHLLVEAAHRAVRTKADPDLRNFYFRLIERKKNAAVAITAVARKLVLRLYRMLHEKIDYTEFRRRGREARRARKPASPAGGGC